MADNEAIAVTQEGVKAIKSLSETIDTGEKSIKADARRLSDINTAGLGGEHTKQIGDAIKAVEEAIKDSSEPIKDIVERLNNLANAYNAIINKDYGYESVKSGK